MARKRKEHYSDVNWNEIVADLHSGSEVRKQIAEARACEALRFFIVAVMKRKYPTYIEKEGKDLIQSGFLGVIKHLMEYSPQKGKPTTFFDFFIEYEMQDWLNNSRNQSSRYYQQTNNKVQAAIRFFETSGVPYNDIKISEKTGLPMTTVKNTLAIINRASPLEINEEISTGDGDETIVPTGNKTPEDEYIAKEKYELLYECMDEVLTPIEKKAITYLFGLSGGGEMPLKDVALKLNMSVNGLKTLQKRALNKLAGSRLSSLIGDKYENSEFWLEEDFSFFPSEDENVQNAEFDFNDLVS